MSEVFSSSREGSERQDPKWASRGWSDEMTPEAIRRRLDKLEQLYQAWLELKKLRPVVLEEFPRKSS
ncbi:MAG: hypothetical protein ACKO81_03855 [Planctomycetota bacterium]